jgi:hypothetical protein
LLTGSDYIAQAGLKLANLLPLSPKCWDYRPMHRAQDGFVAQIKAWIVPNNFYMAQRGFTIPFHLILDVGIIWHRKNLNEIKSHFVNETKKKKKRKKKKGFIGISAQADFTSS